MNIGDVVIHNGRRVILLGLEPMSVPERSARVRDCDTDEVLDVPFDELAEAGGLAPNA